MNDFQIGDRVAYWLSDASRERAGVIVDIEHKRGTTVYDQAGITIYLIKVEGRPDWVDRIYGHKLRPAPLTGPDPWRPTAECPF